ncbi:D-glycero-alpha-D-manno-heptose-1,7-bisphosphate 7-phosphatase [Lacrimispora saccharolytica]|uniref:D,D-heptose 1,7-bisphosphate phosphatase n=1 Tax=Lacrimispora saccharolytica (strain ATCC 35040 / DSM 2544 / NRCC 2533 / WM1) TaxID=610130 RepID=D9QZU1_LACSW|nr:HAD family hydrolase [Lacrimispora saccharolytica]ADL06317.1 hydrolase, HAD-superfamily, subfamily IIIA [[Clostridium] saccharolyticum WM1]QRV19584.1 HAD family hydrolase [Lacrimispora saccharolytica]
MDRIVFLDRDGTINEEVEYLHRPEDLVILPGVPEALSRLREQGFKLVVVTNQAGVARGYYGEGDVNALHEYLNSLLSKKGAFIDRFYYCPHHPVHGIGEYGRECHCRKPDIGMFEMAESCFPVDKSHSYMIGDKLLDTEAGRRYGVGTVLVGTGYGKELYSGLTEEERRNFFDSYAPTMKEAVDWILNREGEWK